MHRSIVTLRSLAALSASAVAVAAFAGPAAGSVRPDDRPNLGVGGVTAEQDALPVRPDDRADRSLPSAGKTSVAVSADADSFGWSDVAGLSVFLFALGLGALSLRYTRSLHST